MIEHALKTRDGKIRVKIPTQLSDVTLGQLIAMQAKPDLNDIEAVSFLSGITVEELNQVTNAGDFLVFTDAILALAYQIKYLYNSDDLPKQVSFLLPGAAKSKTVKVMQNLGIEPAGAYMAAKELIASEVNAHIKEYGEDNWQENFNPSLNACSQVLAHYFFCRATGQKYNEHQAEEFITEIKKMRVTEALPIAKHFFSCYPSLPLPKAGFWHRLQQHWKNVRAYRHLKGLNTSTP